jgi:hypothetical protein
MSTKVKNNTIKNFGFSPNKITSDHYIFGASMVPKDILQADGQWFKFLPIFEKQFNEDFDTYGCTVFGTLNILEILKIKVTNVEENYSDRDLYISSNTRPPGNDPHVVIETVRNLGITRESLLPFRDDIKTLEQYCSLDGREQEILAERQKSLDCFTILHEWVFDSNIPLAQKQKLIIECLRYSPLGISVRAWQQRENGLYYKEIGETDTHWCALIGYTMDEKWFIYDTYDKEVKELEWNYDFGYCKRYYLRPKEPAIIKKSSFWKSIISYILKLIKK